MARSAPSRLAVRTLSIAVFPPPITATCCPRKTGVSLSGSPAFIRFTRVRYSLEDITPMRFSPGMFMKLGNPAPEPTNSPENPISCKSSYERVAPIMVLVSKETPICLSSSISASTTLLGRRYSGIPYFSTPPISCRASNTTTSYPSFAISPAKLSPEGPDPTTAIFLPVGGASVGISTALCSRAQSAANRSR